jgi:hypothetical protein
MRKFSRREVEDAAADGEGFCRRCGERGPVGVEEEDPEGRFTPCEFCGAIGMMPAEGILSILRMVGQEED